MLKHLKRLGIIFFTSVSGVVFITGCGTRDQQRKWLEDNCEEAPAGTYTCECGITDFNPCPEDRQEGDPYNQPVFQIVNGTLVLVRICRGTFGPNQEMVNPVCEAVPPGASIG